MGLDARDCRVDIGFLLGDSTIPDNVYWPNAQRDRSCVWLDFVDVAFSKCKTADADKLEDKTSTACLSTISTGADPCENITDITGTPTIGETGVVCADSSIDVCVGDSAVSTTQKCNDVNVCVEQKETNTTPRKNVVTTTPRRKTTATKIVENTTVDGKVGSVRER